MSPPSCGPRCLGLRLSNWVSLNHHKYLQARCICGPKLATRGTNIPRSELTPAELILMRNLADKIQHESRRSYAHRRSSSVIHNLGLRPLRKVHLTLNDATPAKPCRVQKVVRAWLQHVARASHLHSALAKFWARNICIVRGKPQTVVQRFCNHRQVARCFLARAAIHRGPHNMTFVDANLKIHAPQASSRLVKHWAQRICSWFRSQTSMKVWPSKPFMQMGVCLRSTMSPMSYM